LYTPSLGGLLQTAGLPLPGAASLLPLLLYAAFCSAAWAWGERRKRKT
jgi:hypothetical protein